MKFLIVGLMTAFAVPFVVAALVADLTKWTALVFGVVIGLIGALVLSRHTAIGSPVWRWLGSSDHQAVFFGACWAVAAGIVFLTVAGQRIRGRQLRWKRQPSQSRFAKDCVDYLSSLGWESRGGTSRVFVDIERMENAGRRATFIFSVVPFDIDATRRLMSQMILKPYGPFVVVTWGEEVPNMQEHLARIGWRWLTAAALTQTNDLHRRPEPRTTAPASSAS